MKIGPGRIGFPIRALTLFTVIGLGGCALQDAPWIRAADPGAGPSPAEGAAGPSSPATSTQAFSVPGAPGPVRVSYQPEPVAAKPIASGPVAARAAPARATIGDVWARLRADLRLSPDRPDRLSRNLAWFARHPTFFDRIAVRAKPYLRYLVDKVEGRSMPGEVVLIPMVESGFLPHAYSSERAAGLWQFIPGTARRWGLRINWWYDGRRDLIESTRAALDYLEYLNGVFSGDWLLTIAAYNCGEGAMKRAIAKSRRAGGTTDYWGVRKYLPSETRAYVPRLLAAARILADPAAHGLRLAPIPDEPHFDVVNVGTQIDISIAADMARVSLDDVHRLNPAFNQWATSPDGPHRLLLPKKNADRFRQQLAKLPPGKRIRWTRHVIRKGETLGGISRRYRIGLAALKQANGLHGDRIRAGAALTVPAPAKRTEPPAPLLADGKPSRPRPRTSGRTVHVVRRGDSLWTIARSHEVTVSKLVAWNGLRRDTVLQPGQKVSIREPARPARALVLGRAEPARTEPGTTGLRRIQYTVQRGDSLWDISRRFRVSVDALRRWNGLTRGRHLQPGQQLTVLLDEFPEATSS